MRVSFAVGALTFYPVATTFAFAAEGGAQGVELLVDSSILARGPERYSRMATQHKLPVLTVHSMLQFRKQSLIETIANDVASIRFAATIPTCEAVVLHPPMTGPRPSPDLNRWLEAISQARAESCNPNLRLGLENRGENHDGVEAQFLDDLARLRRLAEEWDLSITLDIAHAASHGLDVIAATQACLPKLANVHLSDANDREMRGGVRNGLFRDHQVPGEGRLPLAEVVGALRAGGYRGPLTIELSPMSLRAFWPPAAKRRARLAIQRVQEFVRPAPATLSWSRSFAPPPVPRREESHEDA